MWREYVAHRVIGTPAEPMLQRVRQCTDWPRRWRHPELHGVFSEPRWIARLIDAHVRDRMNCIDVGCHLGSVLSQIVRRSPHGRHLAIEPVPYKAQWLRRKFPLLDVHQVAVSDQPGAATFYYHPNRSGFSGLRASGHDASVTELPVRCVPLDDLVARLGRPVSFVKLDVEGGELAALRGGRAMLARDRPLVLFECTRSCLAGFGLQPGDMHAFLAGELGYRIHLVRDYVEGRPALSPEAFDAATDYPFQAYNFVAAPAERR